MDEWVGNLFADFAAARYEPLARSAFLLVGDRGHAEDLVQAAMYQTYRAWSRLQATQAAESYTRTTMLRLAGRWSRRRWRGEVPHGQLPARSSGVDLSGPVGVSLDVRSALAGLPLQQRAVLVLRYFDDLTELETARLLGCSVGTVKSRASRGLAQLRASGLLQPTTFTKGSGWMTPSNCTACWWTRPIQSAGSRRRRRCCASSRHGVAGVGWE